MMHSSKQIAIASPAPLGSTLGNQITALRWQRMIETLGHRVEVVNAGSSIEGNWDLVIALHATKSAHWVMQSKALYPGCPVVVCLTGTDLHRDLADSPSSESYRAAQQALYAADQVILLEPRGVEQIREVNLKEEVISKSSVIFQSAEPLADPSDPDESVFEVSLVAHLRDVKDPFRAAIASSLLPDTSRIRIVHFGQALTAEIAEEAEAIQGKHPRYCWLGPHSHAETVQRLSQSRLMVLTSIMEGAPGAISEAIVNGVPVVTSRIPATIGMLGTDYPGMFNVGDTEELARLLSLAETDGNYLDTLREAVKKLRPRFLPEAEVECWRRLLESLF